MSDQISQKRAFGRENNISIKGDRSITIDVRDWGNSCSYTIDLLSLSSKHKNRFQLAWKWLISGIIAVVLTVITNQLLPGVDPLLAESFMLPVNIAGSLVAITCLVMFLVRSSIQHVFYSRHAKIPLVKIWAGKPSMKHCNEFIKYLESNVALLQTRYDLSEDNQLSGEIKMLRRLNEQGIIDESSYEKAKNKLFKRF